MYHVRVALVNDDLLRQFVVQADVDGRWAFRLSRLLVRQQQRLEREDGGLSGLPRAPGILGLDEVGQRAADRV